MASACGGIGAHACRRRLFSLRFANTSGSLRRRGKSGGGASSPLPAHLTTSDDKRGGEKGESDVTTVKAPWHQERRKSWRNVWRHGWTIGASACAAALEYHGRHVAGAKALVCSLAKSITA